VFTDAQKVSIRKYCGYMAFGSVPVPNFAWRYSVQYGDLEFRINNLSADEEAQVITYFLPNLDSLETDIPASSSNLDTDRAAVWYHNKYEVRDRWRLFNSMRRYLCDFIGAAYGPALESTGMCRIV
jgi:hypothetical protein